MSRHLVRSFLFATALSPLVNAGPCRPQPISSSSHTDGLTESELSSILPTDTSFSFGDIYSTSTVTLGDATLSSGSSSGLPLDTTSTPGQTEDPLSTSADTSITSDEEETSTITTSEAVSTVESSQTVTETTLADTTTTSKERDTSTATTATTASTATTGIITTTDTAVTGTTTMTSDAVTTTSAQPEPPCKNNMVNPPLEYRVCGKMGASGGLYYDREGPPGSTKSLLACAKYCSEGSCRGFQFEIDKQCSIWVGPSLSPDDRVTSYKWYQPECFCDLDKVEIPSFEPTCEDNLFNPVPQERACGKMGGGIGLDDNGPGPAGSSESLLACAKACSDGLCSAFTFEAGQQCQFYVGGTVGETDNSITSYKWYDEDCFCDLDKVEITPPEPTCENNLVNPAPQNRVCGAMGGTFGPLYAYSPGPTGSTKSLRACAKACQSDDTCSAIAFEADTICEFYAGGTIGDMDDFTTSYKWYDNDCFCDLDKEETNDPDDETEDLTDGVCTGAPLNPLPANTICGSMGEIAETHLETQRIGPPGTLAECFTACLDWDDCDVFEFLTDSYCHLYKVKVGVDLEPSLVVFNAAVIEWWQPSCFCEFEIAPVD